MSKTLVLLVAVILVSGRALATVIMFEDFEDATLEYTGPSDALGDISNSDYYGRTDLTALPSSVSFSNIQGDDFYAAQDTDSALPTPLDPITLNFTDIDISGFINLSFSVFVAEDDEGANQDWDFDSTLLFQYSIDAGPFTPLFAVEAEGGPGSPNTRPLEDADFNGIGDGAEITDTFTQFTKFIASTGDSLDLRVTMAGLAAGDEDIAFDSITISAELVPEPSTALLLAGGLAGLAAAGRRRSLH